MRSPLGLRAHMRLCWPHDPTDGRSPARRPHGQRVQLLRLDRLVDAGRDRAVSCRTSEHWAVRAVAAAQASRHGVAHLHMRTMSTTCRPSTLLQRRHRTRSRMGRGARRHRLQSSRHTSAASIHPSWRLAWSPPGSSAAVADAGGLGADAGSIKWLRSEERLGVVGAQPPSTSAPSTPSRLGNQLLAGDFYLQF